MVSVIVPIYGVEKFLEPCVRSIMGQTYRDLEIILVDDGSPDRCGEICDALAAEDARIRVIHKPNGGLSSARNAGLDAAAGEYISFIDSDDKIDERFVETMVTRMERDNSDIAVCGYRRLYENGDFKSESIPPSDGVVDKEGYWQIDWRELHSVCVISCNKMFRRRLWSSVRYPLGKVGEDSFVIIDLIDQCRAISLVPQPLYYWTFREGSLTTAFRFFSSADYAEACFLRFDYFLEHGYGLAAENTLGRSVRYLMQIYRNRRSIDAAQYEKYRELRKQYRIRYRRYRKEYPLSSKNRKCAFYMLSENAVRAYERIARWKRSLHSVTAPVLSKNAHQPGKHRQSVSEQEGCGERHIS